MQFQRKRIGWLFLYPGPFKSSEKETAQYGLTDETREWRQKLIFCVITSDIVAAALTPYTCKHPIDSWLHSVLYEHTLTASRHTQFAYCCVCVCVCSCLRSCMLYILMTDTILEFHRVPNIWCNVIGVLPCHSMKLCLGIQLVSMHCHQWIVGTFSHGNDCTNVKTGE